MDDIAILLVDGQEAGLAELAALLQRNGYRTRRVFTETDALAALNTLATHLVFIDLRHPHATSICQRLRDTAVGAVTPLIMMGSPGGIINSVADALAIGADFYFAGPWRDEAILAKVRTYVGKGDPHVIHARPARADPALLARIALGQSRKAANQNVADSPAIIRPRHPDKAAPSDKVPLTTPPAAAQTTPAEPPVVAQTAPAKPPAAAVQAPPAPAPVIVEKVPAAATPPARQTGPRATPPPLPLPAESKVDLTALIQPPAQPPSRPRTRRKAAMATASLPREPANWDGALPAGALDETCHVAQVLAQTWGAQATGRMDWQRGDVRVCLWFHQGSPCGYSSNLAHDHLAEFLSRTGAIRQAAVRQLHLQNLPNPRLTLAYLVRLEEIAPERVWPLLTAHLAEQSYGLFAWEAGAFSWHNDVMPVEERISLGVPTPGWLLEGLRRKYDMPRLVPHVGGPATMVVTCTATEALVSGLHLGDAEARIARLLDGNHTLQDIAGAGEAPLEDVYRLALLLVMLRHAQVVARGKQFGAPGNVDPVREAQRISEKLQQARLCDYFEILGIAADAGTHEVACAATQQLEAFHPGSFNHDLRLQFEAELAEIAEIIGDAREVLGDPGKRHAYAEQVV